MRSRVFQGQTVHRRFAHRGHAFRYRMFWLAVDVDELPELGRRVRGFGHNRVALASIHDRDYGGRRVGSIRDKVFGVLSEAGYDLACERITLVTIPRVAHYVFNPVSFYL
eukprot:TRINITY_DN75839_c0_g1_i1.p4 TRINITY_DN75839_c0_g1~~TRINITY_DN75839_c0_g1_i1.p4  ORF type:complete len:110 (-),score=4.95 TRINITY_DN75839_c0_g1_i1:78-407(-)